MATKNINPLKNVDNIAMMNALRKEMSLEYQTRIPEATKANMRSTIEAITTFAGPRNEFISALVNRIGLVLFKNMIWSNPFAEFKRGMLEFGDTIEEIYVGLLQAHNYDPDRENLERDIFGTEVPPVETNFHRVNRQNYYKVTVLPEMLKRAFLDSGGLSTFVSSLMDAPVTSDNWDEFLLICSLFPEYENQGGYYHVNIPDVNSWDSNGADSRMALRKIRAMGDTLTFPSTRYNAASVPTFAKKEDQILLISPEFKAATDVEALAAAFHIERADMDQRVITVPRDKFGVDGAQAILTTNEFFVIADKLIETTQIQNPVSIAQNYFMHHHEVVSLSRFAPAIMFWTGKDDEVIEVRKHVTAVSAITMTDIDEQASGTEVTRGYLYQATATATTADGEDRGVVFKVSGNGSARTRISAAGVLLVGPDEPSDTLTITVESVQIQDEDVASKSITLTVKGEKSPEWPRDRTAAAPSPGGRIAAVKESKTSEDKVAK